MNFRCGSQQAGSNEKPVTVCSGFIGCELQTAAIPPFPNLRSLAFAVLCAGGSPERLQATSSKRFLGWYTSGIIRTEVEYSLYFSLLGGNSGRERSSLVTASSAIQVFVRPGHTGNRVFAAKNNCASSCAKDHSCRRAIMGSTRMARRAGM